MRRVTNAFRAFAACRAHGGAPLAALGKLSRHVPVLRSAHDKVHETLSEYTDRRRRAFDRRHGTDTVDRIQMKELGLVDDHGKDFDGWAYGPIAAEFFHEMMRAIPRRRELTFFDVGCGKGLPLLLAGAHGFRRVVGLELSSELCQVAETNLERYGKSARPVEADVVCGDFLKHDLPDEPTAFFLNNPFPHYVAKLAMEHIERSVERSPRRVVIAYRRMSLATLNQLHASPTFELHLSTPYWQIFATR